MITLDSPLNGTTVRAYYLRQRKDLHEATERLVQRKAGTLGTKIPLRSYQQDYTLALGRIQGVRNMLVLMNPDLDRQLDELEAGQ
jgi:hypothetical protein